MRQKFGSTLNLRNKVYAYKNTFPEIDPSWNDIREDIIVPQTMTSLLAEETGIHIGDGNISVITDKNGWKSYRYRIDGNLNDERLYHENHIKPLMIELYNYGGFRVLNYKKNSIQSTYCSKLIINFKTRELNLPIGEKNNLVIPNRIINNDEFSKKCLIGIFDTDFNLNRNININGKMKSRRVIKQISKILDRFNIKHNTKYNGDYGSIWINKKGTVKIIEEWGLHNIKHISKYRLWKEYSNYLPFTHTEERLAVLKGKLCIEELEKISNKRKTDSLDKKRFSSMKHCFNDPEPDSNW